MQGCRPLTEAEDAALLRSLPTQRDRCLYLLLRYTGFRISEALSLNVASVRGQDRVTVQRRHMKAARKSRTVLLHPQLKTALEALASDRPDGGPLFVSRLGNRLERTSAWQTLNSAIKRAGLKGKVAFHSARKSFAEDVHAFFGNDVVKTSKALGHSSILTTIAYLSFQEQEMDEAILQLGGESRK